jgi:phage terminase Nu1 subunit (DNA packaging protein)
MAKQKLATQREYAAHLGLSQQAVSKMIKTGRIPTVHGRIDVKAADLALAAVSNDSDIRPLAESMARKEQALARLRELEVEEKEGKVVDVEYVCATEMVVAKNITNTLLSLPPRLCGQLDAKDRRVVNDVATRVVHDALSNLQKIAGLEDCGGLLCEACQRNLGYLDDAE